MSYSLDYLLKSTNLNELFPELSNFELPEINNVWEDWKNSKIIQLIDNGFEYLDLDKKEVFDKLFPGVFGTKDELSLTENPSTICEVSELNQLKPRDHPEDSLNYESEKSTIGGGIQSISSPSIEIITLEDNHNNKLNFTQFDPTQYMPPPPPPQIGEQNNLSQQEYKPNFQLQPVMASTVAAIHRTFSSVYSTAISSAQNAWQNHSNLTPANFSQMINLQNNANVPMNLTQATNVINGEDNKSGAPAWSTLVKKFTSFVSPGYTLGRDSAAYFQLKLPNNEEFTEAWKSDTKLRRIFVNRSCANYGNSSKAREVGDGDCGYVLDCWVSFTDDPNGNKIRNCCSACALHWEKKGRSKKFPENNEKFVLIEASHEHVFEPDGTHLIKLRSNCSSSCPNVKGRKLELRFSLFDLSAKRELFSAPVSIRITRSGKSFENPLLVEF